MGSSLAGVDPDLAASITALDDGVTQSGLRGRITSGVRTHSEQRRLYNRYLAGKSQFPAVPPGASAHEYGLAVDYVIDPFSPDLQAQAGALWLSWGGGWSRNDSVHFELPGASAAAMEAFRSSPDFLEVLATAAGRSTSDVFEPLAGSTPGVKEAIEIAVSQPGKRASLAADIYLYFANLGR